MRIFRIAAICLSLGSFLYAASRKPQQDYPKPGTTVRVDYAAFDPRAHVVPGEFDLQAAPKVDEETPYESTIRSYLDQGDFDRLDDEAHQARVGKVRFKGGVWKLYSFYSGVTTFSKEDFVDESDWNLRLEKLKAWVSAKPDSVTAQIALADAFTNYGWFARGTGAASTVTTVQWSLFGQRAEFARAILKKASQLNEKCPYWYEAMQHVAQAQGWEKAEARDLMEQAVAFEPDYYHAYREYARYLDPRWYGDDGEVEAFADEISKRIGGKQGAFVYFEIAGLLTCQCNGTAEHMKKLSWPKIQEGYEALVQLYEVSSLKRSRFAHMAYLANDQATTQKALIELGDNWDPESWGTRDHFEEVRNWAVGPKPDPNVVGNSLVYVSSSPRNGTDLKVGDQVSFSVTVGYGLATADYGRIYVFLQKDDGDILLPAHRQVVAAINRGTGQATLTDSFEVPPGTSKIYVAMPLIPEGIPQILKPLTLAYPVTQ